LNKASISGFESLRSSESGPLGSIIEQSVHMAFGEDNVSVRQRVCCGTLLRGRFIRFILLSVAVNQGSTLELNTMLHVDLWAKAAAEAGNSIVGIMNTDVFV
jgi:hypothetical protein